MGSSGVAAKIPSAGPRVKVAESATALIAEKLGWVCVCLFGSVARGDWSPQSDIDLLVVGRYSRHCRLLANELDLRFPGERITLQYLSQTTARRAFLTEPDSFVQHLLR